SRLFPFPFSVVSMAGALSKGGPVFLCPTATLFRCFQRNISAGDMDRELAPRRGDLWRDMFVPKKLSFRARSCRCIRSPGNRHPVLFRPLPALFGRALSTVNLLFPDIPATRRDIFAANPSRNHRPGSIFDDY